MAVTTVGTVIRNTKLVLQEVTAAGTRWTNEELIGWLNEFYQAAVQLKPDAFSVNAEMVLVVGTRQQIPTDGLRLIDVMRNTVGDQMAVMVTTRRALDSTRRNWHSDPASLEVEQYVFDDLDPTRFYVYPPAKEGAKLEIIYSAVPTPHDASGGLSGIEGDIFKLNDAYVPVATDYILYRAYSKDAEHAANLNRAQMHRQAFMQQLQGKGQVDAMTSPNVPDGSSSPQRSA